MTPTKEFRDRVGNQYTNMFDMELSIPVLDAWDSLLGESVEHARILRQTFNVEYVEYEPYTKASQMFADLENHTMQVSVLHNTHPLWTTEQNLDFRFAHDILGHWKMGSCHNIFSFVGEVADGGDAHPLAGEDDVRHIIELEMVRSQVKIPSPEDDVPNAD